MESIKTIGLYIKNILYTTGGTESYTVRMVQSLCKIFPEAEFTFVTELYKKNCTPKIIDFVNTLNHKYGTQIQPTRIKLLPVFGSYKNKFSVSFVRKRIENASKQFDIFFYCSRGHYIFKAKKNIAIIHFPMEKLETIKKDANFLKKFFMQKKDQKYMASYDLFLPNSRFTKNFLEKRWTEIPKRKIKLLYPPVMQIPQLKIQKKNQIFVCSRLECDKNLESLMDAFKNSNFLKENYSLIIAGGSDEGSTYLPKLRAMTDGYNIHILDNEPFEKIMQLYNESKFFWHCKGYGINENIEPYKCEHFGITTVEAMSVGCIPIVINKAGQKEIVTENCGEKWLTLEELTQKTEKLAKDENLQAVYAQNAKKRAEIFLMEKFTKNLEDILNEL